MGIIKLQEAGESLTATIKSAERVKGQYGEQVKFALPDGDLYVPLDSALRQLERIPIAIEECAGETLTFSRDPNNSRPGAKPYWGIKLATAHEKQAVAQPSKRLPPPEAQKKPLPFDLDEFPPEEYGQSVADPHGPYADPGPLPPFHKPPVTKAAETAPTAADKMVRARQYLDLLAWVRTQEPTKAMADEAQQAAAATIWIDWKQAGLVK